MMKNFLIHLNLKSAICAAACCALGLAAPSAARAQAVWTNADDRNYDNTGKFVNAFWSFGFVAPDANGHNGHPGNWSGNLVPGEGGPTDVYLGAPGDTQCDVNVTLNSLTFAPGGGLNFYANSSLTVATTNLATDGTITDGGGGGRYPIYTNTGTLTKTAGTGTTAFAGDITLNSMPGSTIAVNSGTLQFPGQSGLFDTVIFNPAAGATINLVSQGATGTFTNYFQGPLTGGPGTGTVLLSGGIMHGSSTVVTTLAFPGAMFQWTGGNLGGYQGHELFTNTGVLNASGDATKTTYAVFTNQGTVNQTGAGDFFVGGNSTASFTNAAGAVFDLQSDAGVGDGDQPFNNAGLFRKSAGTGTSTIIAQFNNQGGTIEVDSGTLQLPIQGAGGNQSTGGTFNVTSPSAVLDLGDGQYFSGTYTGSGAGIVRLSQGTLFNTASSATVLNLPGAMFQWTGGNLGGYEGHNSFTNAGTINLMDDATKTSYATVTNQSTVIQTGAGDFHVGDYRGGGSFTNVAGAVYDLQSDANLTGDAPNSFDNMGLFKKSGGTGTSSLAIHFDNLGGTVEVDSGTLVITGTDGGNGTNTGGNYNPAAGAVIDLGNAFFTGTSTGSGAGTVRLSGALMTATPGTTFAFPGALLQWTGGSISGGPDRPFVNAGTMTLSGDAEKDNYAPFTNTGTMIQTGAGNFSVGTYHDGGSFTNAAGAVYDLQSDAGLTTDFQNTFFNAGRFKKSGGTGTSTLTATFNNTGGTLEVASGTLNFTNNVYDLDNNTLLNGTWIVDDGATLTFANYANGVVVNQGAVTLNGPNSSFPPINKLTDNQGSFSLLAQRQFVTVGDLSNEGTLLLDAGSTLHVAGNFTDSDAATLAFAIGGTAASGPQSAGILQANGTAAVAGKLVFGFASGAALLASTDSVVLLAAASPITGRFANVASGARLATDDGRGSFQVNYGTGSTAPTQVVLTGFVPTGAPTPTPTPTPVIPTVTIVVAGSGDAAEGGSAGKVFVERTGDTSAALTVFYKVQGSAQAGVEYKPLQGVVTIPAGAFKAAVKIKPIDNTLVTGTLVAKVKLKPSATGSYLLGSPAVAKIKVIDND